MTTHPDYPYIYQWKDHLGRIRWRFRKSGQTTYMPGEPHTPEFDAKYQALTGTKTNAEIIRHPAISDGPQTTFKELWRSIVQSQDYRDLDHKTHIGHDFVMREFFDLPVCEGEDLLWGDVAVAKMTADHLEIIKQQLATPVTRFGRLIPILRRMFKIARRKKWRADDPTDLIEFKKGGGRKGGYIGHKPWPLAMIEKFRAFYPVGTPARTAFEVAYWLGNRREDIGTLDWAQLQWVEIDGELAEYFVFEPGKVVNTDEDMTQYRPYNSMIREAIDHMRKESGPVLTTIGGKRGYNPQSLSNMMRYWCEKAGIPKGWKLHGLRKSYAMMVAASGASLWQQKDMLGHTTLAQVTEYARMTDKRRTTRDAAKLLEAAHAKPRPAPGGNIIPMPSRKAG